MPTPPSDPGEDPLSASWMHVGRSIRSFAHDVNNHLGAILAYAELIAADAQSGAETRRMAAEISAAARDSAAQLDILSALVSRDLVTVENIHLNEILPPLSSLFRFELENGGSGLDTEVPKTVCAFGGVRSRIVRALVHALRHAVDRALAEPSPRRVSLRLARHADRFHVEIRVPGIGPGAAEFPGALAEAREDLQYHGGDLTWVAPGFVRIEVPCGTGPIERAPA